MMRSRWLKDAALRSKLVVVAVVGLVSCSIEGFLSQSSFWTVGAVIGSTHGSICSTIPFPQSITSRYLVLHSASSMPREKFTQLLATAPSKEIVEEAQVRLCFVDQLRADVPPPHMFSVPVLGKKICVIVDERGQYHAVRDAFPPLGIPVSETGVVDTEVGVVEDIMFGTRYYLADGTVRGRWCPGGTAGPLLRIARWMPWRLHRPRQIEVFNIKDKSDGALYVNISTNKGTRE
ncbi:unnamed protein product [Choristocarpus tenellus]